MDTNYVLIYSISELPRNPHPPTPYLLNAYQAHPNVFTNLHNGTLANAVNNLQQDSGWDGPVTDWRGKFGPGLRERGNTTNTMLKEYKDFKQDYTDQVCPLAFTVTAVG